MLVVNGSALALDKNGFLADLDDWSPDVAQAFARDENLELTDAHWELIHLVRNFYHTYTIAPAMRVLVKQVKSQLGEDKGSSIYLLGLFPGSPARLLSRIAGLPKPTNCL